MISFLAFGLSVLLCLIGNGFVHELVNGPVDTLVSGTILVIHLVDWPIAIIIADGTFWILSVPAHFIYWQILNDFPIYFLVTELF